MITEVIESIKSAEAEAARIRQAAQFSARKIEDKTQIEIEKLKSAYANELHEKIKSLQATTQHPELNTQRSEVRIDKSKKDTAVEFIVLNLLGGAE